MEFQFRKAAIGGFHRQDVINYLEQIATGHNQQVEELQLYIEDLEDENQKIAKLEADNAKLQQERDQATASLETAQSKLKGAEGEIATLTAANKEAQEKLFALTPDAEAYRSVKERAAGMELEAHVRAQKTIDAAQKEAATLRAEVQQWASQVRSQYGAARGDLNLAVAQGIEGVKAAQKNLDALNHAMAQNDRVLEQLVVQWTKKQNKK